MCTAAAYKTKDFYFGRTLDYDFSYGEEVVVIPRGYCFSFRNMGEIRRHYAMVGMAHMEQGQPLFYDAVNEKGLGMAGLNFVGNARYQDPVQGRDNVATFEFIPWILCRCATVREAEELLLRINLTKTPFSRRLPTAQLHWLISDRTKSVTVESMEDGLHVYENPVGVLTNNPPFEIQMFGLNNYRNLSAKASGNHFAEGLKLEEYCRGMGAMGLPGDLSSQSRFVRAAFVKMNSVSGDSEQESVSQFFHILGSVDQQRGCCHVGEEPVDGKLISKYEITIYTSCANADKGVYYYTSYDNHQISAVDMHREDLEGDAPVRFPLILEEQIRAQN